MNMCCKKLYFCFWLGLILILTTPNVMASEVVTVSNEQELTQAIGSERTILLMPGEYQFSEPLVIRDVVNLSLIGDQTDFLTTSSKATVLTIQSSTNVQIQGVRFGHRPGNEPHGSVLVVTQSERIKIGGAMLYGSGRYGLVVEGVNDFKLTDSIVVGNLQGMGMIRDSQDLTFTNNTFWNNQGGLQIHRGKDVLFKGCEFLENQVGGQTFFHVEESDVLVRESKLTKNRGEYLYQFEEALLVEDNIFSENEFAHTYRYNLRDEFYLGMEQQEIGRMSFAIRNGFDPFFVDEYNRTPLNYAVEVDNPTMVRLLLESGVPVDTVDHQGFTPLCYAAAYTEKEEMIRVLVEHGAKVNQRYKGFTPLIIAASMNPEPEATLALIQAGAKLDQTNHLGGTALLYVAKNSKNRRNLSILVQNGADVNIRYKDGTTPLMYAAESNTDPAMIEALIGLGAQVNAQNQYGRTALMYAIIKDNNLEVIKALLTNGADLTIEDQYGMTALKYVRARDYRNDTKIMEMVQQIIAEQTVQEADSTTIQEDAGSTPVTE